MIGVTDFTSITLNGTNMASAILDGLHEWVDYQVRMIAFNDIGGSPFSPVIVERTKESGILNFSHDNLLLTLLFNIQERCYSYMCRVG